MAALARVVGPPHQPHVNLHVDKLLQAALLVRGGVHVRLATGGRLPAALHIGARRLRSASRWWSAAGVPRPRPKLALFWHPHLGKNYCHGMTYYARRHEIRSGIHAFLYLRSTRRVRCASVFFCMQFILPPPPTTCGVAPKAETFTQPCPPACGLHHADMYVLYCNVCVAPHRPCALQL